MTWLIKMSSAGSMYCKTQNAEMNNRGKHILAVLVFNRLFNLEWFPYYIKVVGTLSLT